MEYPYICKRCLAISFFSDELPNNPVSNDEPDFIPRSCEFCYGKLISTDKSLEEYCDEYKALSGIEIDYINYPELLHPFIKQDYIERYPENIDETLYAERLQYEKELDARREASKNLPRCPECLSTSIITQKQGFGIGKAAAGVLLTGNLLGIAAGGINANKNWNICQKCGHKWKI